MALEIELQELLREPRERPDVELKNWLDLTQAGPKGTLAKALLALANHGGGFVLIGFEDDGTVSPSRPAALGAYLQDSINDVVDRFADPGFHCAVHHVVRSVDSLVYPVIVVPGGHKVPIRSKRGTERNEIQSDKYYIRRPGPASEPPQTGHEWDELMRRCLRGHTDEIASLVRGILEGRAPKAEAKPDSAALLDEWQMKSIARWREVTAGLSPDNAGRFPRGWYSISCLVEGVDLPLPRLRDALQTASEVRLTGWTPWWQPTRQELTPYPYNDETIECWLGRDGNADASHSDFWRASATGQLFLIRGYNEDSLQARGGQYSRVEPGKYFDLTLPVWRVAECLLYVARFAAAADASDASIVIRVEWTGLQDRMLTSLDGRRLLFDGHRATRDAFVSRITVPSERINTALPEIVRDLAAPLFVLFNFFEPPERLYTEEIDRLVRRAF